MNIISMVLLLFCTAIIIFFQLFLNDEYFAEKLLSNTLACMGSTSGYALNADEGRTGSDAFLLSLGYSLYCAVSP